MSWRDIYFAHQETTDLVNRGSSGSMSKGILDSRKLRDINDSSHSEGAIIRSAEFHPKAAVALVAGLNGTASLFQVSKILFKSFPRLKIQ